MLHKIFSLTKADFIERYPLIRQRVLFDHPHGKVVFGNHIDFRAVLASGCAAIVMRANCRVIVGQNIQRQNIRDNNGIDSIVITQGPFREASIVHLTVGKHAIPKADRRLTLKELPHSRIKIRPDIVR